jgi:hypothetical protein
MRATVERKAPDTVYLVVPLCLAICAVISYFIGSTENAVWMALMAYSTSAFGSLVKIDQQASAVEQPTERDLAEATAAHEAQLAGLKSLLDEVHGDRDSKAAQAPAAKIA